MTTHSLPQRHYTNIVKLKPTTQLTLFFLGLLISALAMTSLFQRLLRPFSSTTMHFVPDTPMSVPDGMQKATLAAGCFWGVEHMYRKDFAGKGLIDARVGYIGGDLDNPSYAAVCTGRTNRESNEDKTRTRTSTD